MRGSRQVGVAIVGLAISYGFATSRDSSTGAGQ